MSLGHTLTQITEEILDDANKTYSEAVHAFSYEKLDVHASAHTLPTAELMAAFNKASAAMKEDLKEVPALVEKGMEALAELLIQGLNGEQSAKKSASPFFLFNKQTSDRQKKMAENFETYAVLSHEIHTRLCSATIAQVEAGGNPAMAKILKAHLDM